MNTVSTGTKKNTRVRLLTFTLPVLMFGVLQVGGCMRSTPPPPPAGGTYLSTDGGVTFEQKVMLNNTEEAGQHIARFNLSEAHRPFHDPTTIYIAAQDRGIVISKDNGQTWETKATPLLSTINIAILPDETWVVSGTGEDGQGYVIRSLDKGETWEIVLAVPLPPQERRLTFIQTNTGEASVVLSIAQDPFNKDRVHAGSNLGTVFTGHNSAQAWRTSHSLVEESLVGLQTQNTSAIQKIIPSPNEPDDYLLLMRNRELLRITGGQQQKIEIPRNLDQPNTVFTSSGSLRIYDAEYVPGFPDALIIGVNNGVVLTTDRGATWGKLRVPIDEVLDFSKVTVTTSPTNPNRFLVTFNNILYRSEDAGQTWITYSFGAIGAPGVITDVSIDPTNENNILVVTSPIKI